MIRRRVYEQGGESTDFETGGCPGESKCTPFKIAKIETGNGLDACNGCELLPTKRRTAGIRCPGLECSDFRKAAGNTWLEKAEEACSQCVKCKGNFPINPDDKTEIIEEIDESESLVDDIENIVFYENAGSKTDWSCHPFEYLTLVGIWRECERQIESRQRQRMKVFIESFWSKQ